MKAAALLGFAPFAAFALIEKLVGIVPGLATALAVSLALVAWDALRHRSPSALELGSTVIFAFLMVIALCERPDWSIWEVRLFVDAGLAAVIMLGVLLHRPFTLQHARKAGSADPAHSRDALRRHVILSAAWGLAFAALASVDLYMTAYPGTRDRLGIILTLAIFAGAVHFTRTSVKRFRQEP